MLKLKKIRDPISENLDPYEFKMALSNNGEPEEFLLFIRNSNMNLKMPGALNAGAKIQYLCTLVRGEALHQFGTLSATSENLESIILGLGTYFFPVNAL